MTGAVGIYTACVCAVTLHVSFSVVGYSVACGWGGARDDWRHLTGHVNESRVYGVRGTYVGGLVRWTVHLLVVILYTVYAPLRQRRWTRRGSVDDEDYWIILCKDACLDLCSWCSSPSVTRGSAPDPMVFNFIWGGGVNRSENVKLF